MPSFEISILFIVPFDNIKNVRSATVQLLHGNERDFQRKGEN